MDDKELKAEIKNIVEEQLRGVRTAIRVEIYRQLTPWWMRVFRGFMRWVVSLRDARLAQRYAAMTEEERDALDSKRINEVVKILRTAGTKVPRRSRESMTGTAEVPECAFVRAIMGTEAA